MRKVAIFDIDGTIFRSSLLIEVTEALIQAGIFPARAKKIYARAYRKWLDRQDAYEKYINAVIKAFDRNIKDVKRGDFLPIARKVTSFHKNRVYRYTRDLIKTLKKRNYFLLAISHSPKMLVEEFGKQLGFNKIYGRILEIDQKGRFTGAVLYPGLIFDKAKIVQRAVAKENLTLRNSVGVGDTESDISFLKLVDQPICFNPNQKLYKYAKRADWKIIVERKDVVYFLN